MTDITHKRNHVKMYVTLGTQPDIKSLSSGKRMCNFFAMETSHETIMPTKWFRVICWDQLADSACRHLHKGKTALVMGNLINQEFRTRKGQIKKKAVLVASNIVLLSKEPTHDNDSK